MSATPVCRMATPDDLPALVALEALFPGDRLSRRSLAAAPVSYTHLTLPTICSV